MVAKNRRTRRNLSKSRVLVMGEDVRILNLLSFLLEDEGYEVTATPDISLGLEALELASRPVDLVILDIARPAPESLELCREIRRRRESVALIVLSAARETLLHAGRPPLGVDDYVIKPFDPRQLFTRIAATLGMSPRTMGGSHSQSLVGMAEVGMMQPAGQKERKGKESRLTPTETKVLRCLMRNAGRVLTRDSLINQVWHCDFDGNSQIVDVYIGRLRRKVEPDPSKPRYIKTVRGSGYVFHSPRPCTGQIPGGQSSPVLPRKIAM